ncbi:MAG: hypothetical protein WCK49_05555 [Myxococcaceae bacterium]
MFNKSFFILCVFCLSSLAQPPEKVSDDMPMLFIEDPEELRNLRKAFARAEEAEPSALELVAQYYADAVREEAHDHEMGQFAEEIMRIHLRQMGWFDFKR